MDVDGKPGLDANQLKRRTLTNLYNQRPTWLANAHATLDAAVADAYGWPPDLPDDEVLERLCAQPGAVGCGSHCVGYWFCKNVLYILVRKPTSQGSIG